MTAQHMNTSRFFWGTLWIVAGVLILLAKLDIMTLQVGSLWKFWPLVLVLWGIGLFTGAKADPIADRSRRGDTSGPHHLWGMGRMGFGP
jgi:hypothetical protein